MIVALSQSFAQAVILCGELIQTPRISEDGVRRLAATGLSH
jgi:hypothetical protein